jgi:hypothetical protein
MTFEQEQTEGGNWRDLPANYRLRFSPLNVAVASSRSAIVVRKRSPRKALPAEGANHPPRILLPRVLPFVALPLRLAGFRDQAPGTFLN